MPSRGRVQPELTVGRYLVYDAFAGGGMAVVHFGRLTGAGGFVRTVAIKRLRSALAHDPQFVTMLLDEARLASRIRHPNVVQVLDVVSANESVFLVMEYIHGESLANVLRCASDARAPVPLAIASTVVGGMLSGLHAAHEAVSELGTPLSIVHRDVSPQNVIVGADGIPHVLDFGIAKAKSRLQTTQDDSVRGKVAYMAPEQLQRSRVDARTDVFASAIVLWEMICGRSLFAGDDPAVTGFAVLSAPIARPSALRPDVPPALDDVVMRGLARDPAERFASAAAMQRALESAVTPAPREEVAAWMESFVGDALRARAAHIRAIESDVVADSSGVPSSARAHFDRRRAREVRAAAETNPFGATSVASAHSDDASEPPFDASATHTHRGPPRASRRVWIAAFALAAVAGGFFAAQGVQPRAEAVGNATAPTAEPSPSPPLAPPPTVTDLPRPAPSSEAAPVPVAAPVATTRTRSNPPPPRSRRDCDPPFYWDAKRAVKVYKKECVE